MHGLDFNLSYWIFQTAAMLITCLLIPNLRVSGPLPAFLTVAALAFVNSHFWSTALFLEIPDSLSMKAVSLLLVNGTIFWLVVKLLPGIEIKGVLPAIAAPVVFTVCSLALEQYGKDVDWKRVAGQTRTAIESAQKYFDPPAPEPKPKVK